MKLILRLILRPIYGIRGGIKPPLGPPPAFTGIRWSRPRLLLYRVRRKWHRIISRLYAYSGLPDRWARSFRCRFCYTLTGPGKSACDECAALDTQITQFHKERQQNHPNT